jgi:hypothetical protein
VWRIGKNVGDSAKDKVDKAYERGIRAGEHRGERRAPHDPIIPGAMSDQAAEENQAYRDGYDTGSKRRDKS